MLHRLRHAARTRSFNRQLRGTVEVDEGYFGGKDKNKHKDKRGKTKKALAVGLLERNGELRVPDQFYQPNANGIAFACSPRRARHL